MIIVQHKRIKMSGKCRNGKLQNQCFAFAPWVCEVSLLNYCTHRSVVVQLMDPTYLTWKIHYFFSYLSDIYTKRSVLELTTCYYF